MCGNDWNTGTEWSVWQAALPYGLPADATSSSAKKKIRAVESKAHLCCWPYKHENGMFPTQDNSFGLRIEAVGGMQVQVVVEVAQH